MLDIEYLYNSILSKITGGRIIKKSGFFVTVLFIAVIVLASGCSQNAPEENTTEGTEGEATEEVTEGTTEEITEETTGGISEGDSGYTPAINPDDFVETIDNPYFPLTPGTTFVYEGESGDETIRNEVFVTNETRVIMGVNTTVVRDQEFVDGGLEEETFDWYAQDREGNVWYFGENSREYENGDVVSSAGSWEAGVNGAQPGILIEGNPQVGDNYRQEYLAGEAEDMAEVISLNESVSVAYGSFENCLKTKEWTPLEPGTEENKYYAAGTGLILEMTVKGESERLELANIITE